MRRNVWPVFLQLPAQPGPAQPTSPLSQAAVKLELEQMSSGAEELPSQFLPRRTTGSEEALLFKPPRSGVSC